MTKNESRVGFQYADWQFDGNDLIAVCRLSWNGINYHDANTITFHRLRKFSSVEDGRLAAALRFQPASRCSLNRPGLFEARVVN